MIKYYDDLSQGTDEWLNARLGILTASRTKDLLTKTLSISKAKTIDTFACELASQRITGRIEEMPTSWHMERGHIEEGLAIDAYSSQGVTVKECGFITNDNYGFMLGFSPDGLIGNDGFIEIKSRMPKFQIETVCADEVPIEYMAQIQTGFLVCERKWCDFIQFSNGLPLYIKRVLPDDDLMDMIQVVSKSFNKKIDLLVEEFNERTADSIKTEYVDHANLDEIE